jgi:hypothetical protein
MTHHVVAGVLALVIASAASGQESGLEEIVVTGSRAAQAAPLPAVTIRKRADFLLQAVTIENDTREAKNRKDETYQTLRGMVQAASRVPGLSLALQKGYLETLDESNYQITLRDDGDRDDTSSATVFVKLALTSASDVGKSVRAMEDFVKNTRPVGRTAVESAGEVALSVVNPERYRGEVVSAIAASVRNMRSTFGDRCKIQLGDLSRRLQWQRTDVSDLTLFLPYEMTVTEC